MRVRVRHRRFGALLLAWLGVCALPGCAPPTTPDVLLIVVDTLRADRLGSYGYQHPTFAIDALAEESVRFENAFAQAPRSAPSLASLLTSELPSRHGLTRFGASLSPELPTLAEAFAQAGYDTFLVSAGADMVDPASGLSRGFDVVELQLPLPADRTPATDPALARDRVVTRRALELIDPPRESPFFLVVHYLGPHAPYDPKRRDKRGGTSLYRGIVDGSLAQLAQASRGQVQFDILDLAHLSGLYDGKVQGADDAVGNLLRSLRLADRFDDMLIVLTSDHGEALRGDDALFHGTTLYREQLRVPLLVHRPGGKGGGETVSRAVGLVDVGPTLLELAGLSDARETAGRSLVPDLDGAGPDAAAAPGVVSELPPDPAWSAVWGPERHRAAVSTQRWTLLTGARDGAVELYDVASDPQQETDLAAAQPEVVESLRRALPE